MHIRKYACATIIGGLSLLLGGTANAWTINDTYDNQSAGQRCGSFWQGQEDSQVSSENSSSGSHSCKMRITQGNNGWGGGFVYPSPLRKGDEYWMRFRVFMPAGFDYGVYSAGDTLKFIRLDIKDTNGTPSFLDWEWRREGTVPPQGLILQRDNCNSYQECWQFFGPASSAPVRGTWETWEIYVKYDTVAADQGGQGRVRAWKNGVLVGDQTRRRTMNNASDYVESTHLFSYWNGGAPKTQHLYFDDLVATSDRPSATDAQGNPYIGMGSFVAIAPPLPPSGIN